MDSEISGAELLHRVKALEKKMDGNGRPGLIERMASIERSMAIQTRLLYAVFTACVGILLKIFAG